MRRRSAIAAAILAMAGLLGVHLAVAEPAPFPTRVVARSAYVAPTYRGPTTNSAAEWHELAPKLQLARFYAWAAAQPPPETVVHGPRTTNYAQPAGPAPAAYDSGSIAGMICSTFGDQCARAVRVATCESGLDPSAVNRNNRHVRGIFQIHDSHAASWLTVIGVPYEESWMNAADNIAFAYWLWQQSGWGPWACRG